MKTNINTMFPEAKGYATAANAQKVLDRYVGSECSHLTVVVQRPDQKWLPVVVFQPASADYLNIAFLASKNICTCGSV